MLFIRRAALGLGLSTLPMGVIVPVVEPIMKSLGWGGETQRLEPLLAAERAEQLKKDLEGSGLKELRAREKEIDKRIRDAGARERAQLKVDLSVLEEMKVAAKEQRRRENASWWRRGWWWSSAP